MSLKRTMIYLDSEDHRALFERAFKESRVYCSPRIQTVGR